MVWRFYTVRGAAPDPPPPSHLQLRLELDTIFLQRRATGANGLVHAAGPVRLAHANDHLAGPLLNPLDAGRNGVVLQSLNNLAAHGFAHDGLKLQQPLFHLPAGGRGGNDVRQLHHLALGGDHLGNVQLVGKVELADALEALFQVGLHARRVLGL